MIQDTCHCGSVSISLTDKPAYMNDCDCSVCSKSGALWGYFRPDQVDITGTTSRFSRTDRDSAVSIHFCPSCGSTTHWSIKESFLEQLDNPEQADRMGVNMRLFERAGLNGIEIRFPDGQNWNGKGAYGFRRDAIEMSAELY